MRKKVPGVVAAASVLLMVSGAGGAATVTRVFEVRLTILNNCTVDAISDLDFGNQAFLSVDVDSATSITVNCTKGTSAVVDLSGTGGARTMTNGTDTIAYDLYQDAGRTTYWDATTTVTITGAGVDASGATLDASTGATGTTRTIYGRVPAQNTNTTGAYADTVTATVTF